MRGGGSKERESVSGAEVGEGEVGVSLGGGADAAEAVRPRAARFNPARRSGLSTFVASYHDFSKFLGANDKASFYRVHSGLFAKEQPWLRGDIRLYNLLFKAVIEDNREVVVNLLARRPDLLLFDPSKLIQFGRKKIAVNSLGLSPVQSPFTWQTFKPVNALVFAIARWQAEMI